MKCLERISTCHWAWLWLCDVCSSRRPWQKKWAVSVPCQYHWQKLTVRFRMMSDILEFQVRHTKDIDCAIQFLEENIFLQIIDFFRLHSQGRISAGDEILGFYGAKPNWNMLTSCESAEWPVCIRVRACLRACVHAIVFMCVCTCMCVCVSSWAHFVTALQPLCLCVEPSLRFSDCLAGLIACLWSFTNEKIALDLFKASTTFDLWNSCPLSCQMLFQKSKFEWMPGSSTLKQRDAQHNWTTCDCGSRINILHINSGVQQHNNTALMASPLYLGVRTHLPHVPADL